MPSLTIAEFESKLGNEKPYYEFWYGEAIQKELPTWIHGLLQRILMELLQQDGYKAASEVSVKIDPAFHPVPDLIATRKSIEFPYPTKAVEIVVEILSDSDPMSRLLTKCRAYQTWGFEEIYVVDPPARLIYRWSGQCLEEVSHFANQPASKIWQLLDQEISSS